MRNEACGPSVCHPVIIDCESAGLSTPKKHHFVPRMLLEAFADADGWLYWCRRGAGKPVVRPARPETIFHKNNLYSIVSAEGDKDPSIEKGLARLEGDAGPVIRTIIESARARQVPPLSVDQMRIWYLFLSLQWRRTPEGQEAVADDAAIISMFEEALAGLRNALPHRRTEIDALDNEAARRRTVRNVRAETLTQFGRDVLAVLEGRGIAVLRITSPSKSFIIGSRPVIKLTNPGRTDLRDPDVEMWLPISSDVAVGVGDGSGGIILIETASDRHIRHINECIAAQSSLIAGRAPALIRSLATPR